MKKKLLIFVSFFLLLIPFTAKASIDGFTITNYDVNIIVSEKNTLDITEKITVVYDQLYKHGIIREIPLKYKYSGTVNGKEVTVRQRPKIKNVTVDYDYSKSKEEENLNLKIGKSYEYCEVGKEYTYTIKLSFLFSFVL